MFPSVKDIEEQEENQQNKVTDFDKNKNKVVEESDESKKKQEAIQKMIDML